MINDEGQTLTQRAGKKAGKYLHDIKIYRTFVMSLKVGDADREDSEVL
jgi:hypothetical protein